MRGFPVRGIGRNRLLLDDEAAALIEVAEDAPAEVDVPNQPGFDFGDAIGGHGDRHGAFHAPVDHGLAVWLVEVGVGLESQRDQLAPGFLVLGAGVFVKEGVGQGGDHVAGAAVIVLLALLFLYELLRVDEQALQALIFFLTVGGTERLAVDQKQTANDAVVCFDHLAGFSAVGSFPGEPEGVVGIVGVRLQLVVDGLTNQNHRIGGQVGLGRDLRRPRTRRPQHDGGGFEPERRFSN